MIHSSSDSKSKRRRRRRLLILEEEDNEDKVKKKDPNKKNGEEEIVKHPENQDAATNDVTSSSNKPAREEASSLLTFPSKLHIMLKQAESEGFQSIVSWLPPDNTTFKVHDPEKFVVEVMPQFFHMTKYKSFIRQLNIWSFMLDKTRQEDSSSLSTTTRKGGYSHRLFVRGKPELCKQMKRTKNKGLYKRKRPRAGRMDSMASSTTGESCPPPSGFTNIRSDLFFGTADDTAFSGSFLQQTNNTIKKLAPIVPNMSNKDEKRGDDAQTKRPAAVSPSAAKATPFFKTKNLTSNKRTKRTMVEKNLAHKEGDIVMVSLKPSDPERLHPTMMGLAPTLPHQYLPSTSHNRRDASFQTSFRQIALPFTTPPNTFNHTVTRSLNHQGMDTPPETRGRFQQLQGPQNHEELEISDEDMKYIMLGIQMGVEGGKSKQQRKRRRSLYDTVCVLIS